MEPGEKRKTSGSQTLVARLIGEAKKRLKVFLSLESSVLVGEDPEAIHDMRVASRRLQVSLNLLARVYPSIPFKETIDPVRKTRRTLGTIRNCDVSIALLQAMQRRSRRRPHPLALVEASIRKQRDRELRRVRRRLPKINVARTYDRIMSLLESISLNHNEYGSQYTDITTLMNDRIRSRLEAFDASIQTFREENTPGNIHPIRIAAKRLRYLLEIVGKLGMDRTKIPVWVMKRIQKALGDWHDLENLEIAILETCNSSGVLKKDAGTAIDLLREVQRLGKRKARHVSSFLAAIDNDKWKLHWLENNIGEEETPADMVADMPDSTS